MARFELTKRVPKALVLPLHHIRIYAPTKGFEPLLLVLETNVLPLLLCGCIVVQDRFELSTLSSSNSRSTIGATVLYWLPTQDRTGDQSFADLCLTSLAIGSYRSSRGIEPSSFLFTREVLFHLSYAGIWSRWQDSNLQPHAPKARILPDWTTPSYNKKPFLVEKGFWTWWTRKIILMYMHNNPHNILLDIGDRRYAMYFLLESSYKLALILYY